MNEITNYQSLQQVTKDILIKTTTVINLNNILSYLYLDCELKEYKQRNER